MVTLVESHATILFIVLFYFCEFDFTVLIT